MILRSEKLKRNREVDKNKPIGQSFFDAPINSKLCNCGKKSVHQGHCQECWDKIRKDVVKEFKNMHDQIKATGNRGISEQEFKLCCPQLYPQS